MTEERYNQKMHCDNCDYFYIGDFAKGVPASGWYTCPNCGCRDAKATGMPQGEKDR